MTTDRHIPSPIMNKIMNEIMNEKTENYLPMPSDSRKELELWKQKSLVFSDTLDLNILLYRTDKFVESVMIFCNEIASRFQCSRVSLGWIENGYARIQGFSHIENFEDKMEAVQKLEDAMEEACGQDREIVYPGTEKQNYIRLAHSSYCKNYGSDNMISLPLRIDKETVAVLSCERLSMPFSKLELRKLRLICDYTVVRLNDLRMGDRWFGKKITDWGRKKLEMLLGPENTLAKTLALLISILFIIILFGRLTYKVENPCILKTDNIIYISAPYEGYVDNVNVRSGDFVNEGSILLNMDTKELLLQESSAIADIHQYSREMEKFRAQNALSDMRIADARLDRAKAQLERVHYYLNHGEIKAPFSGIVVEGDKTELTGAAVRKGDILFKLAQLKDFYLLLDCKEQDIHEISVGAEGEMSFLTRPELTFPVRVIQINPVAKVKDGGNIFEIRAEFNAEEALWWRPGMSGLTKITIEKRSILWILTHRTIDFIRLHFWW
jgi:hypothetical protein